MLVSGACDKPWAMHVENVDFHPYNAVKICTVWGCAGNIGQPVYCWKIPDHIFCFRRFPSPGFWCCVSFTLYLQWLLSSAYHHAIACLRWTLKIVSSLNPIHYTQAAPQPPFSTSAARGRFYEWNIHLWKDGLWNDYPNNPWPNPHYQNLISSSE
jgi:hypothetical protein